MPLTEELIAVAIAEGRRHDRAWDQIRLVAFAAIKWADAETQFDEDRAAGVLLHETDSLKRILEDEQ